MRKNNTFAAVTESENNNAVALLENTAAANGFLEKLEEKLRQSQLANRVFSDIRDLADLLKNWVSGQYREVPFRTILAVAVALIYFVSPVDAIPDVLIGIGLTDDAAVIAACIKAIEDDLENFRAWRACREDGKKEQLS